MRVVIVEDESRARRALRNLLYKVDPTVAVVGESGNGEEGIFIIRRQMPDVVFVDIKMPKMSGLDMIRKLYQEEIHTEFVIISGYSEFDYARQGIELDVAGYILKPVTYEDVEQIILKLKKKNRSANVEREIREKIAVPNIHAAEEQCRNLLVKRTIRYVNEKIGASCRLSAIAREQKVSPEHLSRVFHEEMNVTFSDYVKLVKMDYAMALLKGTDMKIQNVARTVGFENEKYFSTVFREIVGMTPTQYREQRG